MPKPRPAANGKSTGDLERVRALAEIAVEYDLAEVESDPSGRVRISRRAPGAAANLSSVAVPPPPTPLLRPVAEAPAEAGPTINSPFVGTFYRASSPDAAPFADVGQNVRKGQVVCIVEAMKLMNEIESEVDGKIIDVLVKNGEHVEYGQALFRLQKA